MTNKTSSNNSLTVTPSRPNVSVTPPGEKQDNFVFSRYKSISGHKKVFNFNRYTTIKSIGIGFLIVAMTVQTAMDIKHLVKLEKVEKHWKYPMLSLLVFQLGLLIIEKSLLIFMGLLNVQSPAKQRAASRANVTSSILLTVISILRVITNQMLTDDFMTKPNN